MCFVSNYDFSSRTPMVVDGPYQFTQPFFSSKDKMSALVVIDVDDLSELEIEYLARTSKRKFDAFLATYVNNYKDFVSLHICVN